MGEVNLSEIALAQEGTADVWPLPKLGATVQGLRLPVGLKAVPFLIAAEPHGDLVDMTFEIPNDDPSDDDRYVRFKVTIPSRLAAAWAAFEPKSSVEELIDGLNEALETAERRDLQKTRIGDYLAHVLEMANRFMGDESRAVIAIPKSQITVGDMIASAVAWWDKGRHEEIGE